MTTVKKNIVVFGETGVGKSSLINLLLNEYRAEVSSSAIGCTFSYSCYETLDRKFFDTAGFNEGTKGRVKSRDALNNVIKLLKSLKDGVHLLIFVTKQGRITSTMEQNYKIFVKTICQNKVPTLLVITHCEMELKMGDWYAQEKPKFEQDYKMTFSSVISACATKGQGLHETLRNLLKERYTETQAILNAAIAINELKDPWLMSSFAGWLTVIVIDFTNYFRSWFGYESQPMHVPLKDALIEAGHKTDEAVSICNDICRSSI